MTAQRLTPLFHVLTPISNQGRQTRPGSSRPTLPTPQAHGARAPNRPETSASARASTAVVTIQNARMSARRNAMVNGDRDLVEGTGVLLSVRVDIGEKAEGLIVFQQDMVFQHKAV